MKTGNKRNPNIPILLSMIGMVFAIMACSSQTSSNGQSPNESTGQDTSIEPSPPLTNVTCYEGIQPGQTTKTEAIALLGEPVASEQTGSDEVLLYPSPLAGQFNTIILENLIVVFSSIVMDEDTTLVLTSIKAQYGEPVQIAYSYYAMGSKVYIYPEKGFALIGDENFDIVYVKQCFAPVSLEGYMERWGKELPAEDPFVE